MVVYVSRGILCVRDSERARALCVRDVWFSEQHVLTTLQVHAKWINTDRSHVTRKGSPLYFARGLADAHDMRTLRMSCLIVSCLAPVCHHPLR